MKGGGGEDDHQVSQGSYREPGSHGSTVRSGVIEYGEEGSVYCVDDPTLSFRKYASAILLTLKKRNKLKKKQDQIYSYKKSLIVVSVKHKSV